MPTYTFIDSDLLNTVLLSDEPERLPSLATRTTSSLQGPKATALIQSVNDKNDEHGTLLGEIDWKEHTLSIGGVGARWDELKSKPAGVNDSTREWGWIGKKYRVKYDHDVWRARVGSAHAKVEATFTLRKNRVLHHSSPATIDFTSDVSLQDRLFLILVLIFCEKKRQERKVNNHMSG
ncbi:hypothetical protein DXG01_004876 [Tephrocybe rancida]|nr:hypothetical protein DXG01_004876 [Tephrocybe rancida]